MHTLLIEDNITLAQTVTRYLANEDITCTLRTDGTEGYMAAIDNNYDVIILDIELPSMDGIEICRKLRTEWKATPIIMLTSRSTSDDIIKGLDYGADDYLVKPCDYRELTSRIRALGRRNNNQKSTEIIEIWDLCINQENHEVTQRDSSIGLSKREYELLLYFMQNAPRILSKTELAEKVWWIYDAWADQKVVEVYIGYLRKKLWTHIIETHKWVGYSLNPTL
jgi:DNA-binding response OmpR family regulator